jgi:LmbE family N-acetylglucosaminyl deacetylase
LKGEGGLSRDAELLNRFCGEGEPPRVLMVVAHPDDEVIGAGVRLRWLGERVTIVHVTDGAPADPRDALRAGLISAEHYAAARRSDMLEAMSLVKISDTQLVQLGFQDQGVVHQITEVADAVSDLVRKIEPEIVLTHPYEGGHPDHDAVALAVRMAVGRCAAALAVLPPVPPHPGGEGQGEGEQIANTSACDEFSRDTPAVLEMTSYHLGPEGLHSGEFLSSNTPTRFLQLTAQERALKQKLFARFRTQQHVLRWFRTDVEAFRVAPQYDFTRPPHLGILFYEQFKIGMTWREWRAHVDTAMRKFKRAAERHDSSQRDEFHLDSTIP